MDKKKKEVPQSFRQKHPKNRKNKTVLVFDEKEREEFLTGFRKRKNERRKKAQDELKQQLREEKIKKRQEIRESRHKEVHSHKCQPIPSLEGLVQKETYNLDRHTVTIADVTSVDFVGSGGLMLGKNLEESEDEVEESAETEKYEVKNNNKPKKPDFKKHNLKKPNHKKLKHPKGKLRTKQKHSDKKRKRKRNAPRNPPQ